MKANALSQNISEIATRQIALAIEPRQSDHIRNLLRSKDATMSTLLNYVSESGFICVGTSCTTDEKEIDGKMVQTHIDVQSRFRFDQEQDKCGVSLHYIDGDLRLNVFDFGRHQYFGTNGIFRNLSKEKIMGPDLILHPMSLDDGLKGFAKREFGLELK